MITVLQRAEVERARARRIVACAQAAAHAAARGVRRGPLPPPVAVPLLPGQVAVAPQQPGVMGPPLPPPPPPPLPPSEAAHGVDASERKTQGQEEAAGSASDQQVEVGGGDATMSGTSTGTSGSAAGDPRPRPKSPEKVSAGGDALSDCGPPVSTDTPCDGAKSDGAKSDGGGDGNGITGTEKSPTGGDGVAGECQQELVPPVPAAVADAADDGEKSLPAPPALNSALSQEKKPLSSSPLAEKSAADTPVAAAGGGDGSSATGAGVVGDQAAHPAVTAEVVAGESVGAPRAPTPPVVTTTGAVAAAPAVMFPVQAGQQQQPQQRVQQQGAAMLPSAAQQAQYNLGMNADLFHMKHMEINLSQEEVERADLRSVLRRWGAGCDDRRLAAPLFSKRGKYIS